MTDDETRGKAWLTRIRRVARWQPRNHLQAWLFAAFTGLTLALIRLAVGQGSYVFAAITTGAIGILMFGVGGSYRLRRAADARAVEMNRQMMRW
jgi:hypothetical protein